MRMDDIEVFSAKQALSEVIGLHIKGNIHLDKEDLAFIHQSEEKIHFMDSFSPTQSTVIPKEFYAEILGYKDVNLMVTKGTFDKQENAVYLLGAHMNDRYTFSLIEKIH